MEVEVVQPTNEVSTLVNNLGDAASLLPLPTSSEDDAARSLLNKLMLNHSVHLLPIQLVNLLTGYKLPWRTTYRYEMEIGSIILEAVLRFG